jgi:hypothetical protein
VTGSIDFDLRRDGEAPRRVRLAGVGLCALLGWATAARAITFADPVTFAEKRSWSAAMVGVPANLAGIRFSSDGTTLYAVGKADLPTSAVYAIPVVRDPGTNEITDLGTASATPFFAANVSTTEGGLDSGPEEGPSGTLFYTYFNANAGNFIGERRAGDLAMEMQFDLAPKGVPLWLSGLAFAPSRIDPATGFGTLQVSVYNGDPDTTPRDVYEVPLSPLGDGFFSPGTATRLLSVAEGTVNGICYATAAPLVGSLMYTSFDAGEVRYIDIDPATGLAIDATSGLPELGTTDARNHLFASGLSVGPVGLDFDPLTSDLFISTNRGDPFNTIIQVGGFSAVSSTTTSTTPTTSTSTTVATATTTTTTLTPGCLDDVSFASLSCRLDALAAAVAAVPDTGKAGDRLERKLAGATARLEGAEGRLAAGRKRAAKRAIGRAIRLVRGFRSGLGSRAAAVIPEAAREGFRTSAAAIEAGLLALKQGI